MMYCIGIGEPDKSPRYVSTCDDHWYTTTSVKLFQFTQNQVNTIITQLRNHLQFKIFVLDQNGEVIFNTTKQKNMPEKAESKTTGLVIKIRV